MIDEAVVEGIAPSARLHTRRVTVPGATAFKRRVQIDGDSVEWAVSQGDLFPLFKKMPLQVPFTPERFKNNDDSAETSAASLKSIELPVGEADNNKASTTTQSKSTECTEAALPMALYCAKRRTNA